MDEKQTLVSLENVSVAFGKERSVAVTDKVSFDIKKGEFFALVGESGCGKSVTAMSILKLLPEPGAKISSGKVFFEGKNILELSSKELKLIRGKKIACIFQEAMAALNPVLSIRKQLEEAKLKEDSPERILELMRFAGFSDPERVLNSYPHELSGGMLQRICIVMALLPRPSLLIADEPTTALDVTVQAQVMELLKKLSKEFGTAVLLITHNMGLVAQYASRVAVMYAGRIVECGFAEDVIKNPMHPYKKGLLAALPDGKKSLEDLQSIPGIVPAPLDFVEGCRFCDRCFNAKPCCKDFPPLYEKENHWTRCFFPVHLSENS